ncbi:MAG: TonB-dependent receptor [Acidobacteria bacterium]|nr:TonB-dependent receptor [Acidobacteriota bacterium]
MSRMFRALFIGAVLGATFTVSNPGTRFAAAQGITTGGLTGEVGDQAGAVLPKTTITAVNSATGARVTQNSREDGGFSLLNLPAGYYTITFSSPGFADAVLKDVQVNVGTRDVGKVALKPSSVQTTVEVTTANPIIDLNEAQVSTTFEPEQIANLPLANGFDAVTLLEPGITQTHDNNFSNNNGATFSANGQRGRSNNFEIDGQSNNDNSVAGPQVFFGNQDAIAGIQVITNNFSAQYGRNMGTVVNYLTRSGTNHIHGTLFELYEGSWGEAFLQGQKTPLFGYCAAGEDSADGCLPPTLPRFTANNFGGTIGMPIIKDKLWAFAGAYFGRNHQGEGVYTSGTALFPTPDSLQALQAAGAGSGPVASLVNSGPYAVSKGNPHPGAVVPDASTIVTVNGTDVPVDFAPVIRQETGRNDDEELIGRLDWQPTTRDHIFARYIYQDDPFLGAYGDSSAADIAGGHAYDVPGTTHSIGADITHTFSPSWVNQLRYSFQQAKIVFEGGSQPECTVNTPTKCNASMGVSGTLDAGGLYTFLGYGYASSFPQGRTVKVTQVQDNATWIHGRHTFSFGGEWSFQNSPNPFLPSYNGAISAGSLQSFLDNNSTLNLADGAYTIHFTEPDAAGYIQDDWKLTQDLTLNLGMRWEYFGQAVNLLHDETTKREADPSTAFWDTTLPLSARTFPGVAENYKNFQPRVGFAYNPKDFAPRLVIRGGFAINFDPEFYNMFLNAGTSAPVVNLGTITCSTASPCIPSSGSTGADMRTQNLDKIPLGQNPNARNQTTVSSDFHNPYSESYSLGIEYGFNNNVVMEIRYVGNHTVGLFQSLNANPRMLQTAQDYPDTLSTSLFCSDPTQIGYRRPNCSQTRVRERANTAFSNYNGVQLNLTTRQYHHMSGTLAYTYSRTIDNSSDVFSTFGGGNSVTFSENPFSTDITERGVSGNSIPHVASASFVYELPFFEKQNGFIGKLLGGYQLNGIWTFDTGQPVTPYMVDYGQLFGGSGPHSFPGLSNYCDGNFASGFNSSVSTCRPVLSNKKAPIQSTGIYLSPDSAENTWGVDPGYYTLASAFSYLFGETDADGNPILPVPTSPDAVHWLWNNTDIADVQGNPFPGVGRNTLRANRWDKLDASIFKTIKLHENYSLQLQFAAYNVLNKRLLGTNDPELDDTGTFWNSDYNGGTSARQVQLGARITF